MFDIRNYIDLTLPLEFEWRETKRGKRLQVAKYVSDGERNITIVFDVDDDAIQQFSPDEKHKKWQCLTTRVIVPKGEISPGTTFFLIGVILLAPLD